MYIVQFHVLYILICKYRHKQIGSARQKNRNRQKKKNQKTEKVPSTVNKVPGTKLLDHKLLDHKFLQL